jgi:hypothetical protein
VIIGSSILGLAEYLLLKTTWLWYLLVGVIASHLFVGIIYAARSLKYENDGRKIVLPFIFFAFHFSYGWGTLKGFLKSLYSKQ